MASLKSRIAAMKKQGITFVDQRHDGVVIEWNKGRSGHYPYNDIHEWMWVSAQIDVENMCIKTYPSSGEHWTYATMVRRENDPRNRYQSREYAMRYVPQEAIELAEDIVRDSINAEFKNVRKGRKHPTYKMLKPIADEVIVNFKTDFEYHNALAFATRDPQVFIWAVNRSGCWMMSARHGIHDATMENEQKYWDHRRETEYQYYYFNHGNLEPVEFTRARAIYSEFPQADAQHPA